MWNKIKSFLLVNQSVRQTVAKNAFWTAAGQLSGRLIRAALIIYAARALGAESWGAFSYAVSLAAFLTIFSDIGISSWLIREGSKNPESRSIYLSTALFVKIVLIAIGSIIFLAITYNFINNAEVIALLPIVILLTAVDGLRDLTNSVARSAQKMELEAWSHITTNLGILMFGFAAIFLYNSSFALATGYTIGSSIGLAAIVAAVRKYFKGIFKNFSPSLVKPMLKNAWPFGLASLMGVIMINTDVIMLGFLRSVEEVGLYSAAQKIILLIYILPGFLIGPIMPVLSGIAANPELFRKILTKSLRILLIAALPVAAGGLLLGNEIIYLLFGQEYLRAAMSFQILSITMITNFISVAMIAAIFAYGRQREMIIYALIGIIGNFILDIMLIPRFGMAGVASATLTIQLIITIYAYSKMRDLIETKQVVNLGRPIFATAIMFVAVFAGKILFLPVLVLVAAGGIIYFSALWLTKEPMLLEIKALFR